jgi:hypothetical protein
MRVRYLVVGGIAVILHGVNRFTWDVDLAVELTTDNLDRLTKALARIGFVPRVPAPVQGLADPATRKLWAEQKQMKVYPFVERRSPPRMIDVMVNPLPKFETIYRRRVVVHPHGVSVPLVPVDVLVKMKRKAGRPEDRLDVQALKQLGKAP